MSKYARRAPVLDQLLRDPKDQALLDLPFQADVGRFEIEPSTGLARILGAPGCFGLLDASAKGVPLRFDVPEFNDFEGVHPAPKECEWHVRITVDEVTYLIAKTPTLREGADIFIEAEDYYDAYGIGALPPRAPGELLPPAATLKRLLRYDPDTGVLTWRRRFPLEGDKDKRKILAFNQTQAGGPAFSTYRGDGELVGMLYGLMHKRYRIIWKMIQGRELATGASPKDREAYAEFEMRQRDLDTRFSSL